MEKVKTKGEIALEWLSERAKSKGGLLLSEHYVSRKDPLNFRCAAGHDFLSKPINIRSGTWCPQCKILARRSWTPASLANYCASRGGKLLTEEHLLTGSGAAISVQCGKGHLWNTYVGNLAARVWCPECAKISRPLAKKANRLKKINEKS